MKKYIISLSVICLCGCSFNHLRLSETTTNPTNGLATTRSMDINTQNLWPARSTLDKQRASLGKTMSAGTSGLDQDSGGTNIASTIEAITHLMQAIPK